MKLKELYEKEGGKFPEPILNLKWDYADEKGRFDPHKMAKRSTAISLGCDTEGSDRQRHQFQEGRSGPDVRIPAGRREHLLWQLALLRELHQCREMMARRGKEEPHWPRALSNWAWCWR